MKFILGFKLGMAQVFDEKGNVIPVTLIEAGPCIVTQVKIEESRGVAKDKSSGKKDGYEAIQVGLQGIKEKKIKKTQKKKPFRYLKEFRGDIDVSKYKEGDTIDVSIFQEGDKVKVTGLSKGKGFAGVVKKWGFSGRPATHGTKHELRTPGSVGSSYPERVIKGRKMAGRMGHERKTVKNLKIIKVDPEKNLIALQGAVPGVKGALLEIRG
jgi:large subunit ribosomal protein L3